MAQQFYSFSDFSTLRRKYPYTCRYAPNADRRPAVVNAYQHVLLRGEKVDAEEMANMLFPDGPRDVFISHRGRDTAYAHAVQEELRTTSGLCCFIDSDVWHDMYRIVEPYQQDLALRGASLLEVNRLVSQFTLLLRDALVRMVESCPIFLFVAPEEMLAAARNGRIETDSPWINLELQEARKRYLAQQTRRTLPVCNSRTAQQESMSFLRYRPAMEFLSPLCLNGLSTLKKK